MEQKTKIYRDIICIEAPSRTGGKWWYQVGELAYSPMHVNSVRGVKYGTLTTNRKPIAVVHAVIDGRLQMVAINTMRTDVPALVRRGMWPQELPVPFENPVYTAHPENGEIEF